MTVHDYPETQPTANARDARQEDAGLSSVRWQLLAILLLALLVRLIGIAKESLWLDEATSLMLARMDVPTLVEWTALDIHPPLYYVLLHYWINLGDSELVIRGLSVLAGVLTVYVTYELGHGLFGVRAGLAAAFVLSIDPFHIWYSQEARMYAWVTLWVAATLALALRAMDGGRMRHWVGYVLVAVAGLYTHYYAIFGLGLANLFFLYQIVRRRVDLRRFGQWALAQAAVLVLFLPWLPTFLLPITVGGGGWLAMGSGRPTVAVLAQTALYYMVGTGRALYPLWLRRVGYAALVGLFLLGLVWWRRRDADEPRGSWTHVERLGICLAYLTLPMAAAWIASQLFKPMYNPRYMLPFLVPFVLLIGRGVAVLPQRWLRFGAAAAVVLVMGYGIYAQVEMQDKPDWRGLAETIGASARPGDIVLFMPGWHAKPFDYYAQGELELYSDVPIPVDTYGAEAVATVEEAVAGHPRVWFVWEDGHYTDSQGAVHAWLDERLELVDSWQMPLLGQVMLYEQPGAENGS